MSIIDLTKARVSKSGNIITPKGRISYAQFLLEAQEKKFDDSDKIVKSYSGNLLIPKGYDLLELKKKMGKIALEKCDGDQKRAKAFVEKRFLDPNNLPQGGKPMGEEFEGWTLIRASSKYKPKFAYPNGKEIPAEEIANELYSGRWGCFSINPYWSANKKNPGVMLGLQNVQLLDHAENLGGKIPNAEDDFDAVDGTDAGGDAGAGSKEAVDDMFG